MYGKIYTYINVYVYIYVYIYIQIYIYIHIYFFIHIYINIGQIAMEGGVLFGTYKGTLTFLNAVIPDEWNKHFLFESILSKMEETIF
jgi:hypothetical protein